MDTKEMASLMIGREVNTDLEKSPPNFRNLVLEVNNLTVKNAQGFTMVDNVSFKIRGGEVFAIAGVSGNGQVELADAIAGLVPIANGQIQLLDNDITKSNVRERLELGMRYIPEDRQTYGLVLEFDVANNTVLRDYYNTEYCNKRFLKQDAFIKQADKLINKYDIRCANGPYTNTRSMSGGNQQKIIIGREVERQVPFLIFVQPTRGLDIGAIENIHKEIIAQRDKGSAILLISLELEEVMNLADTIGVIYNGKIQTVAPVTDLTTKQVGEFMMGVKSK